MKKLFPLMFALVFASQAFAEESEVVSTEVVATQVAPTEEVTKSVVTDETAKAEAAAVYDELKTRGLTDAEIVTTVEEKLRNETTENASRSILDQKNQERFVWILVGAAATCGVIYGVIPGVKWAHTKLTATSVAGQGQPDAGKAPEKSTETPAK